MNAYEIAQTLAANAGGFTINRDGSIPTHGASVAVADSLVSDHLDTLEIGVYVAQHPEIDSFGIWQDSETGFVYVDSVLIVSLEIALTIGAARGEIAVFDLDTMTEIRL